MLYKIAPKQSEQTKNPPTLEPLSDNKDLQNKYTEYDSPASNFSEATIAGGVG